MTSFAVPFLHSSRTYLRYGGSCTVLSPKIPVNLLFQMSKPSCVLYSSYSSCSTVGRKPGPSVRYELYPHLIDLWFVTQDLQTINKWNVLSIFLKQKFRIKYPGGLNIKVSPGPSTLSSICITEPETLVFFPKDPV